MVNWTHLCGPRLQQSASNWKLSVDQLWRHQQKWSKFNQDSRSYLCLVCLICLNWRVLCRFVMGKGTSCTSASWALRPKICHISFMWFRKSLSLLLFPLCQTGCDRMFGVKRPTVVRKDYGMCLTFCNSFETTRSTSWELFFQMQTPMTLWNWGRMHPLHSCRSCLRLFWGKASYVWQESLLNQCFQLSTPIPPQALLAVGETDQQEASPCLRQSYNLIELTESTPCDKCSFVILCLCSWVDESNRVDKVSC